MGVIVVPGVVAPPPYAPTLLTPTNGSYADLSGMPTFTWQYNAGQVGNTQSAWQFYVLINGGSTAHYFNATSGLFQTSPVWNSGSIQSYTFPSGAFTDGNVYQWTVATRDINGTGPPAGLFTVNAQMPPVVTVLTPAGTITTATPVVAWVGSYPEGATQTSYRVIIYDSAQYTSGGFTPGTTVGSYDTGQVGSSYVTSIDLAAVPIYLADNESWRAYVQVTETGGEFSAWAYSGFTTSYTQPKTPTVSTVTGTDPTTGCPLIKITVTSYDNLLSLLDANPTLGIGTWAPLTNCNALTFGVHGFAMTATTGATMSAETGFYAVEPSTEYGAIASFLTAVHARACTVGIAWYTSGGSLISTSTGSGITDNTSTATKATEGSVTSPSNAAQAKIVVTVDASVTGEVHYVSFPALLPGTSTTWGAGGFVGLQEVILLRSDGEFVRGASKANPGTMPPATQVFVVDDYEAIPTVDYTYEAAILVSYGPNQDVLSGTGTSSPAIAISSALGWWELDPTNPSSAVNAQLTQFEPQITEQSTAHLVQGQQTPNIVANVMGGTDGTAEVSTFTAAIYASFLSLLTSQKTVFISNPYGEGTGIDYVRFGPQTGGLSSGSGNKVHDSTLQPSTASGPYQKFSVTWVAQARPPV